MQLLLTSDNWKSEIIIVTATVMFLRGKLLKVKRKKKKKK